MDVSEKIEEAKRILARDGKEALLKYCTTNFGENDGIGVAEDIIELWGEE